MAEKRIVNEQAFDHLDKLLAQFHPVRQPDSFFMTEAMRDKIAEKVKPMLVAKAEAPAFRYAGMDIIAHPAGTVVLNTKTGERATIDENSVLSVIRADCVIIPAMRAALEPRDER